MKKINLLLFLFLPLLSFAQDYQEEVSQEVVNGQEVTVIRTTSTKVIKAQPKSDAPVSTTTAVPNQTNVLPNSSTTNEVSSNGLSLKKSEVKRITKEESLEWLFKTLSTGFLNPKSGE